MYIREMDTFALLLGLRYFSDPYAKNAYADELIRLLPMYKLEVN